MIRMIAISAGLVGLSAFGGIGLATAHSLVFDAAGKPVLSEFTTVSGKILSSTAPDTKNSGLPAPEMVQTVTLAKAEAVLPEAYAPNGSTDVIVGTNAFAPVTSPAPRSRDQHDAVDVLAQTTFAPRPPVQRATTGVPVPVPVGTPTLQPTWLLGVFR